LKISQTSRSTLRERAARTGVTGVYERLSVGVEPIAERSEVRREVMDFGCPDGPAGAFDYAARAQLANPWSGADAPESAYGEHRKETDRGNL